MRIIYAHPGVHVPGRPVHEMHRSAARIALGLLLLLLLQVAAASANNGPDLEKRSGDATVGPRRGRRGLRWAVSHPSPAAPFLLGPNSGGWANTTRSVAEATVGILVQPIVFGMNTSGMLTCEFPDLMTTAGALKPFADKGLETVVSVFPWVGGMSPGDYSASGGYRGPSNQGLNCTTAVAKNVTDPRSQYCVTPDMLVRAALARKEEFALELGQLLKQVGASGFSLDWEYFYGNNQTNAAALWSSVKKT